jgi:hypothetical protein
VAEFKAFSEIARLSSNVTITEKIHGTNAQIYIAEGDYPGEVDVRAGSRTRWLTPDDDNYGFAKWVEENKTALVEKLGLGRHFGEWYGSGINAGYGLKEKRLALFDTRFDGKELPAGVDVVPVLYQGPWNPFVVETAMAELKEKGSRIAPGFMKPEGIVIRFDRNGVLFKHVFEAEEMGWKKGLPKPTPAKPDAPEVLALMQPIRLEKLLSRDERYLREYPASLPQIVKDYYADLEKEGQLLTVSDAGVLKTLGKRLYPWVKEVLSEKGYAA